MKKIITLILGISMITAHADVNQAVDNFFNSIQADVNAPTVIQGQSAGIISGGGFSTRSQVVNLQLAHFTPPSFNSSCGNMNFFSGSMSFLTNTDQLIAFLQNALMTAGVTAVMTALKAATPNIAGTLQSMFNEANKIMGMFNNSCQLGMALGNVAGTWAGDAYEKTTGYSLSQAGDTAGAFINNTVNGSGIGTITSSLSKVADKYQKWVNENAVVNPSSNDSQTKEFAEKYGSIIWKGMQQLKLYSLPSSTSGTSANVADIANLVISITGDLIIYSPDNDSTGEDFYDQPPLIEDLKTFMTSESGSLEVYNCNYFNPNSPGECIRGTSFNNSTYEYPTTTYNGGIIKKIQKANADIQAHFISNTPLTNDDMLIISISPMPIYAIAQTLDDIGIPYAIKDVLNKYSKQLAFQILQNLIRTAVDAANRAATSRMVNEETQAAIASFISEIHETQAEINSYASIYNKDYDPVEIMQKLNFLKATAQNMMSPDLIQKINFAKQMNSY